MYEKCAVIIQHKNIMQHLLHTLFLTQTLNWCTLS